MEAITIARLPKNEREQVRVVLDEFKGARLVDMRVFADFTSTNIAMPTKKGLSLRVEQIDPLIDALQQARDKAADLGWIDG